MIGAARRGGVWPLYRSGTRCPSCDGGAWSVGRTSAECAGCGVVLDLHAGSSRGPGTTTIMDRRRAV